MPFAITLGLDATAAVTVEAMWQMLASRRISDDAIQLKYAPHVTLAVLADSADSEQLLAAARDHAERWPQLPITLASLGVFPPATLFLAPVVARELLERQATLLGCLGDETVVPHYQIDHFVPHVTLAQDLKDPAEAIAALGPLRLPIKAMLDRIEVVRFRPVELLASHKLTEV
jgi:2'-5' RNA ligase